MRRHLTPALTLILAIAGLPALAAKSPSIRATDAAPAGDPVLHDAVVAYEVRSALIQELQEEGLDLEVLVSGGLRPPLGEGG